MFLSFLIYYSLAVESDFFTENPQFVTTDQMKSVAESKPEKEDKCYEELNPHIQKMCVNLDSKKRKALAVSILICEYTKDGRESLLPVYTNDDDFVSSLGNEQFKDFTTWYTGIDSLCFHYAHEQLSTNNLKKILNVYKAVTLSTEFLIAARDNLEQTTKTLREKLVNVQDQIFEQASSIQNMTEIIKNTTEKIIEITDQFLKYKNSISNAKYYLFAIGISIVASFVFPNVFMPVLFVTGVFLFIEVNMKPKYAYFKYIYATICFLILFLSIWDRIGLIKVKFFDVFKKKRSRRMPRICD